MSTLWQKPAEMRWEVTFASETRPLALSFAMGFFKGTGSAKVVCGKSNNSQKTLEKRLCSLLNQLSCRRPWAKGTSREDRFYSLGWQKSNFFGPKQHLVCFLKNQPGLCGQRALFCTRVRNSHRQPHFRAGHWLPARGPWTSRGGETWDLS